MSDLPKIPASAAKLFSKRRRRREIVQASVPMASAETSIDKSVEPVKIDPVPTVTVPVTSPKTPSGIRRRG